MSLTKQIHLYSIDTSAFYEPKEQQIHQELLKLYTLRKQHLPKWKKSSVNRLIKKRKDNLVQLLEQRLYDNNPRKLNSSMLIDKNVISLFESALTRALDISTNTLTYDLMIVNVFFFQVFKSLVRDGFEYNGEKYIFLTASAGQIRTKRAVFVKESAYQKIQSRIMCGLSIEDINSQGGINPNKFLSYLALNNSATDVWEDFDIDKSIVVDDFESDVFGEVDFIDDITYKITRQKANTEICQTDGCGMMLDGPTRMVRLPWVKGLLVQFPFDDFIREKCPNGQCIVTDIYGEDHDILAEGIRYIFTKSQFKLAKYFHSWDCYKERFKNNQCEACYCNIEEDYIPKARINYQMLQTLSDMKDEEMDKLIKPTIEEIESIGNDYQTTMRLLGATDYNKNPSYFQQALMLYPELFRDQYCRDILKQTKKSLVKQAKAGRLRVNGRYRFVSPDLYAFCEWLFLGEQNPKGLLADGEVYVNEFRDGDELACLRSPHLYREWPIRVNKRNEETEKWFGGTKCVYTSCHDLISRIVQLDWDGDKLLVVKDRLLTKIAKRNMENIVPLAYNLQKAKGGFLSWESMYEGMVHAYTGGNIGPISNNITKVWNSENIGQEQLNVVGWLTFYNNAVIDYAKTLWLPQPPKQITKTIQSYTKAKVPNFFQYAKDKRGEPKTNKEKEINLPSQVELSNNSTMNRIASKIPDPKIKFSKTISKFDYRMLMNLNCDFSILSNNPVIKSYDYWNARQYLFNIEEDKHQKQEDIYIYQQIRQKIIADCKDKSLDYIVNTLVAYLYTVRQSSQKKTLWASFGDIIVINLQNNLKNNDKICPICGKRFQLKKNNQNYCSESCYNVARKERIVARRNNSLM